MAPQEVFNAADYLVERNVRAGHGGDIAVVAPSGRLRYSELAAEIRRIAGGLARLGVRQEERVLLCMVDELELFTGILAALHLGAVAVPCSTMYTGHELGALVADARARVVLGSAEFGTNVRTAVAEAPEVTHLVLTGTELDGVRDGVTVHAWDELRGGEAAGQAYATWPDSSALWLYTSGTTGTPKAAMHRHADIRLVAENYGEQVLGVQAGDRCLSVAKLFFAYGIGNSMFFPLAAGASALLEPGRPSPELFARRAAEYGASLLFGTPSFFGPLLASDVPDEAFGTVRLGASAGEALPARMYHGVRERFGVEILDGIGSTEMLHIYLSNRAGAVHPGSSGTPVPGYEVQIRDERAALVDEPGEPGELWVRGESAATGYWCRAGTSRRVFCGEWMRTGDTYTRNEDGTYTCLGRQNDMLKVGGIWVAPSEVEDRILDFPGAAEVAVVGVPDGDGLDKPVACVVAVDGVLDPEAVVAWCREGLASFKRPRTVLRVDELPKTATGKIRRNVLRELVRGESRATAPDRGIGLPAVPGAAPSSPSVAPYPPGPARWG